MPCRLAPAPMILAVSSFSRRKPGKFKQIAAKIFHKGANSLVNQLSKCRRKVSHISSVEPRVRPSRACFAKPISRESPSSLRLWQTILEILYILALSNASHCLYSVENDLILSPLHIFNNHSNSFRVIAASFACRLKTDWMESVRIHYLIWKFIIFFQARILIGTFFVGVYLSTKLTDF